MRYLFFTCKPGVINQMDENDFLSIIFLISILCYLLGTVTQCSRPSGCYTIGTYIFFKQFFIHYNMFKWIRHQAQHALAVFPSALTL